ncbi:MAG: hypothetical protein K0Q47_928, partial [Sedimentibacter sp.]|nr:hypothetical protein [Sedimentibacter sp.]
MDNKMTPKFLKDDSIIYFIVIICLIAVFLIEGMYVYVGFAAL